MLWTPRGRLAKVPGRVAFPEELNLAPYTAAAAPPLLPVAQPLASHPLASLSNLHHAHDLARPSMRSHGVENQRAAASSATQPPAGTSFHVRRSSDSLLAVSKRGGQKCSNSTGVGSAGGADLASAAAEVVEQQSGAAVRRPKWKPGIGASLMYRLAAVMVHHGDAQSGHYTVYRKASVDKGDSHMNPKAATHEDHQQQAVNCAINDAFLEQVRCGDRALNCGGCRHTCKSRWVHASDEDVRTASLIEVLSSEAAVLLYERAIQ